MLVMHSLLYEIVGGLELSLAVRFFEVGHLQEAWNDASNIAAMLLSTDITVDGLQKATHYHTTKVQPRWARKWKPCQRIKEHIFYCKEE